MTGSIHRSLIQHHLYKEASVNGMDQPHRSSTNSPDGVSTKKTATLRSKLEGEIKFSSRGKSLSHSPTPGPTMTRRRTASTDQLTPVKDDPPPPVQQLITFTITTSQCSSSTSVRPTSIKVTAGSESGT